MATGSFNSNPRQFGRRQKCAALLLVLGACRFEPGHLRPDARKPYCDPADSTLVACYPFDGDTLDASANHVDATQANVGFVAGVIGEALQFGDTSAADVAESSVFDPPAITIEGWVNVTVLPATGARMGILDNNGEYGLFIYETGTLRCSGIATVMSAAIITAGVWHHVACTHDDTRSALYVDGAIVDQVANTPGAVLGTGGTTGVSLAADNPPGNGSRLIGELDELRILNVARPEVEICEDAGTCVP